MRSDNLVNARQQLLTCTCARLLYQIYTGHVLFHDLDNVLSTMIRVLLTDYD